jgi:ubiquinone/menaquinone biosynthesis C-methylase UbiE
MGRKSDPRDAIERFDAWSSSYEKSFLWRHFFEPVHLVMLAEVGDVSGLSILDLGCGTGDMLRRFSMSGGRRVVGIDASSGMLRVAGGLCKDHDNIELVGGSAEALPFPEGEFDLVTSCIAFHHFPDPEGTLNEVRRVLKPGGRMCLCDLDGEGFAGRVMLAYGRLKKDDRYFDRESMLAMAGQAGLEARGARKVRAFPPVMIVAAQRPEEPGNTERGGPA